MMKTKSIPLSVIACLGLTGCIEDEKLITGPEMISIEASEDKESHFFATDSEFRLSDNDVALIESILKDMQVRGESNVGFTLLSDKAIAEDIQETVKNRIRSLMYKYGFINSRIIDSGTVVYESARTGIRIDVLRYNVKNIDLNQWDDSPGDCSIKKGLPKYGTTSSYNLVEMIANKADLIAPRKYRGQRTKDAIASMDSSPSSSSSSSSSSKSSSSSSGSLSSK